jgi:hypothetical protein
MTEQYTTIHTACGEKYAYARKNDTLSDSGDVRSSYEHASRKGNYFSEGALRFFGSRNFDTVAPGVSVELQTKAPGNRYRVETWKVSDDPREGNQPWFGCWHATRREAVKCAKATAELLRA